MSPFSRRRLLTLAASIPLAGCAANAPELEASEIASGISASLNVHEFQALVDSPGTVIIDVRTPEEYAESHLDNAINIDVSDDHFDDEIAQLDPEATYAVYCRSGNRSQDAMERMLTAGFRKVCHLDGGIQAWTDAGLPVVR